ncbi:TPA: hypothetical protein PFE25_001399 [Kluyvera ascorbata]|nr:hypothetical protein [Kluyvera ascorbata]
MKINDIYLSFIPLSLFLTSCSDSYTGKAASQTGQMMDNGHYVGAIISAPWRFTVSTISDIVTLGGTLSESTGAQIMAGASAVAIGNQAYRNSKASGESDDVANMRKTNAQNSFSRQLVDTQTAGKYNNELSQSLSEAPKGGAIIQAQNCLVDNDSLDGRRNKDVHPVINKCDLSVVIYICQHSTSDTSCEKQHTHEMRIASGHENYDYNEAIRDNKLIAVCASGSRWDADETECVKK